MRVNYSHHLNALIVATKNSSGETSLVFVDPDTGENLSRAMKDNADVTTIKGLGVKERVFALVVWPYTKNGQMWHFILVGLSGGSLLVVSADRERERVDGTVSPTLFDRWQDLLGEGMQRIPYDGQLQLHDEVSIVINYNFGWNCFCAHD